MVIITKSYPITNGDFSHGPQHVFWTCLDHIVKSKDMSPKKNTYFLDKLTPKGPQRSKRAFLILGRLSKLDNRLDSCEILCNRVLPRVLANKIIFIKNT